MKHARDALNDAYRTASEEHQGVLDDQRIRRVFQVILIAISGEDSGIKTWEDVRGTVKEAVDAHLSDDMTEVQDSVESVLMDIVNRAARETKTYVSPPAFQ